MAVYDKNHSGAGDEPDDNLDDMVEAGRTIDQETDAAAKAAQRRIAARERLEAKIAETAAKERRRRRNIALIISAIVVIIALIVAIVLVVDKVKDDKARAAAAEAAKWANCEWIADTTVHNMIKETEKKKTDIEDQWKQFKDTQWLELSEEQKQEYQKEYDHAIASVNAAIAYAPTQNALLKSKARKVSAPKNGTYPRTGYDLTVLDTSAGKIHVKMIHRHAPCNTAAFKKMIQAKYFNNTECHRLTNVQSLHVVQCGDPTGTGVGSSGFISPDETPDYLVTASGGNQQGSVVYPKGTIGVANSGANTGSSQFFIVLKDSQLSPDYTVIGTVDPGDFPVLDRIHGYDIITAPGNIAPTDNKPVEDGTSATPIKIKSWKVTDTKGVAAPQK